MAIRAVIFDLGGVVFGSPLHAIAAYEVARDIAPGAINRVVVEASADGAWARLERGELGLETFYPAFEADCGGAGVEIDARELMQAVSEATTPRPAMLTAIARIRASGRQAAALTNNWVAEDGSMGVVREHFDVFIESAVEGMRKPDPRIFHLTCERLGVAPNEAAFLDDIGLNLKTARALGMTTIKVVDADSALAELEDVLGMPLREP